MSSGERFPLVIDNRHGRPTFDVTAFLLRERRPRGVQFNTLKAHAEAIRFFLTWAAFTAIDLDARLSEGRLLSFDEVEDLAGAVRLGFGGLATQGLKPAKPGRTKTRSVERTFRQSQRIQLGVDPTVAGTRIRYIADYLDWIVKARCRPPRGSRSDLGVGISPGEIGSLLRARAPKSQNRNPDSEREALSEEAQDALLAATAAESTKNPFERAFVRDRNELIILLFYHLGLRQGELLKLKVGAAHFNAQKRILNITRSPDDPGDTRLDAPQAKTNARSLELSDRLTKRILDHLVNHRRLRKHAPSHSFLFVSQSGHPLSKSAIKKIFSTIRSTVEGLDGKLSPHQLRHTFNENLSEMFDTSGTSDENEKRIRAYLNGWAPQSETASIYLRRRTRRSAHKLGIKLQQKLEQGPDRE